MVSSLLCEAESTHDDLNMALEFLPGPDWVIDNEWRLTHMPDHVRNNMKTNKGMRQGFTNMCDLFAECLRRKRVPSVR